MAFASLIVKEYVPAADVVVPALSSWMKTFAPSTGAPWLFVTLPEMVAAAQTTNPLEVLEGARRDRIEQDKRLDRDAAEQQQRDKEIKARQEEAGRTPDPAIARGTEGSAIGARQ